MQTHLFVRVVLLANKLHGAFQTNEMPRASEREYLVLSLHQPGPLDNGAVLTIDERSVLRPHHLPVGWTLRGVLLCQ